MHGLTVRWSLKGSSERVEREVRAYVTEKSHASFTGRRDLRFKTWRLVPGEWVEGCYVFSTSTARAQFQDDFEQKADQTPISQLVGAGPVLVEPHEVLAIAEGWDGFVSEPDYEGHDGASAD
jgi:hypothetical protein